MLDIKDPVHPKRVDAVNDPNYSYWHSASFSNDGSKVVFTDEWGGGLGARCRPTTPSSGAPTPSSISRTTSSPSPATTSCPPPRATPKTASPTTARSSPSPAATSKCRPGTRAASPSWTSPTPPTPSRSPTSTAAPSNPKTLVLGGDWSAYWYNGNIYGSEIARGLDVFQLTPSKFLTQNEIDAASLVQVNELNVQNQQKIVWPPTLKVAQAYLDQLARSKALPEEKLASLNEAVSKAQSSNLGKKEVARLHTMAASIESAASTAKDPADAKRLRALAQILESPTA